MVGTIVDFAFIALLGSLLGSQGKLFQRFQEELGLEGFSMPGFCDTPDMILEVARDCQPHLCPPLPLPCHVPHTGLGHRDHTRGSRCSGTARHKINTQKRLQYRRQPQREEPSG